MSTLLLQSCSASKREVEGTLPAFELYSGYFYKILKKCIREGELRSDVEIAILSAKYGLLDTAEEIEYYDRRMDSQRARELNSSVVDAVAERIHEAGHDRVVVNMGETYREAISGLSDLVDVPIVEIHGDGIGEKGSALHGFIRGDDSVLREAVAV